MKYSLSSSLNLARVCEKSGFNRREVFVLLLYGICELEFHSMWYSNSRLLRIEMDKPLKSFEMRNFYSRGIVPASTLKNICLQALSYYSFIVKVVLHVVNQRLKTLRL